MLQSLVNSLENEDDQNIEQTLQNLSQKTKKEEHITELFRLGAFPKLMRLLRQENGKYRSLVLSIIANCANFGNDWTGAFCKEDGISILVNLLKNETDPSLINRVARLLANLSNNGASIFTDEESQNQFIICSLVKHCSTTATSHTKCQASCLRALRILCVAHSKGVKIAVDYEQFVTLLTLLKSPSPDIMLLCVRMVCEFLKTQTQEIGYRVIEQSVLQSIFSLASHSSEDTRELIMEILFLLSMNNGCRVVVSMEGGIEIFVTRIKTLEYTPGFKYALQSLCLCAREAVSRNKMKLCGALPFMVSVLKREDFEQFHESIVAAFVWFLFDDESLALIIRADVAPSLFKYLDQLSEIEYQVHEQQLDDGDEQNKPPNDNVTGLPTVMNQPETLTNGINQWKNTSPETSPFHGNSQQYSIPSPSQHMSQGYSPSSSPPHSPNSFPSYSPQHLPNYSPQHSPQFSPQHSPPYSPNCSASSSFSDALLLPSSDQLMHHQDEYSDTLNESGPPLKNSKAVPYHFQSADGIHAMIHGTRGPIHDTFLLLSRFSQATDPSILFLKINSFNSLLNHLILTYHHRKCLRIVDRITLNSQCFPAMISNILIPRLYLRLCTGWSLEHLTEMLREVKSMSTATDDTAECRPDSCTPAIKESKDMGNTTPSKATFIFKAPSLKISDMGQVYMSNLRSQCESDYGRGVISHIMMTGSKQLQNTCLVSIPHVVWSLKFQRRVFVQLKALDMLMDLMSKLLEMTDEMFVLVVEAVVAFSRSIGMSVLGKCNTNMSSIRYVENEDDQEEAEIESSKKKLKLDSSTKDAKTLDNNSHDNNTITFILPSGRTIECLKKRLCRYSEVFDRMLSSKQSKYIESKLTSIPIEDVNEDSFVKMIHFLSGCKIHMDSAKNECEQCELGGSNPRNSKTSQNLTSEASTNENNSISAFDLLSCSNRFFVDTLTNNCEDYLLGQINVENVADFYMSSTWCQCNVLAESSLVFLLTRVECPKLRTEYFLAILQSREKESFITNIRKLFDKRTTSLRE